MSVYHGVRSMERSAEIGDSVVLLEKEPVTEEEEELEIEAVKMDQQEEQTVPTQPCMSLATAAGVEKAPVHVRRESGEELITHTTHQSLTHVALSVFQETFTFQNHKTYFL